MVDNLSKGNIERSGASGGRSANTADLAPAVPSSSPAKRQKIRETSVDDEDNQRASSDVESFSPVPRSEAPLQADQDSPGAHHVARLPLNSTGSRKRARGHPNSDDSEVEVTAVRPRQDRPAASFTSPQRGDNIYQPLSSDVGPFVSLTNAYPTTPSRPAANTGSDIPATPVQGVLHTPGTPVTPSHITPQKRAAGEWLPLDRKERTLIIYLLSHDVSVASAGRAISEMRLMGKHAVNHGTTSAQQFVDGLRSHKRYTLEGVRTFVRNATRQAIDEGWALYRRRAIDWDEEDLVGVKGTARDRAAERRALETFRRNRGRDPVAGERQFDTYQREQEQEEERGYTDGDFEGLQKFLLGRIQRYVQVRR